MAKNWMKTAVKRPGAFRAKAQKAGMSTSAFASKVLANSGSYDPRTVKQANLARTFSRFRKHEETEWRASLIEAIVEAVSTTPRAALRSKLKMSNDKIKGLYDIDHHVMQKIAGTSNSRHHTVLSNVLDSARKTREANYTKYRVTKRIPGTN